MGLYGYEGGGGSNGLRTSDVKNKTDREWGRV